MILSGKAFTAHQALELGLIDKIETFEEFRSEKFKDIPVFHDRVRTADAPRMFRFPTSSQDTPIEQMLTSLISMEVDQIVNLDIKEFLVQTLDKMTPDQIRSVIGELAGISAEFNMKRIISSVNP